MDLWGFWSFGADMRRGISGLILIVVLLVGAGAAYASSAAVIPLPFRSTTAVADAAMEQLVFDLVARERRAAALRPLVWSPSLRTVARRYGSELFSRGSLSHRSPDGSDPLGRLMQADVAFRLVGENLAYAGDARTAHLRLMGSPPHRRNILSPAFGRIGIGVLNAGRGGIIVVEVFTD